MKKRFQKRRKVAILGCGPAGIFAAHALDLVGIPFTIYSNKRISEMFGAQYLHAPIPGLSGAPFRITYRLRGPLSGYAEKVYGRDFDPSAASPASLEGEHDAWDIREAYLKGFERYADRIEHRPGLLPADVAEIEAEHRGAVISSVPAPALCAKLHQFNAARIWAIGDAPERGIDCPVKQPDNTVVCNGDAEPLWYRASTVQGYSTVEWPDSVGKPPFSGAAEVAKPIKTNCDCFPKIFRVGRYGKWTKGVLSHEAYYDVASNI